MSSSQYLQEQWRSRSNGGNQQKIRPFSYQAGPSSLQHQFGQPKPVLKQVISNGKTHEDYLETCNPRVKHLDIGDLDDMSLTVHSAKVFNLSSIIRAYREANATASRTIVNYQLAGYLLDLVITVRDGKTTRSLQPLLAKSVEHNSFMIALLNNSSSDANQVWHCEVGLPNHWVTSESFKFGIEMITGRNPIHWFCTENVDESVPQGVSETVRESIQRMLLILQFLATVAFMKLPEAYSDVGINFMRQEIDIWNIELVLSFLVLDQRSNWEPSSSQPGYPRTYEKVDEAVDQTLRRYDHTNHNSHLAKKMTNVIATFIRDNLTDIKELSPTWISSYALDSGLSSFDAWCLHPAPDEIKTYKHRLATLRIVSKCLGDLKSDGLYFGYKYIWPMVLVCLPFGLLKFFIYHSNLQVREKFALAQFASQLRTGFQAQAAKDFAERSDLKQVIIWKRKEWTVGSVLGYNDWPMRHKWTEVPYLVRMITHDKRRIEGFVFRRYLFEWIVMPVGEWLALKEEVDQADEKKLESYKPRIEETRAIMKEVLGE